MPTLVVGMPNVRCAAAGHGIQRCVLAAAILLGVATTAAAQEHLYQQEPFDRIILDAQNNNAVLEVAPLVLPGRKVPENPDPKDKLLFHLIDQPAKAYEVAWESVAKVELFENMLLDEAQQLAKKGRGNLAYEYFRFLFERYPKLAGLDAAFNEFLYEEAKQAQRSKNFPAALAALRELHDRDPQREGLGGALTSVTEQQIEQYQAAENYPAAHQLLKNLAAWYPQEPAVEKWQSQWKQAAAELLQQGRAALAAGELRQADEIARRLAQVWPQLPGAKELARTLHEKYPRVVVAVTMGAATMDPERFDDWAARRSARLVHRGVTELTAPGTQGGSYIFPCGELQFDPKTPQIMLKFKSGQRWQGVDAAVAACDVAARLSSLIAPGKTYRADLADCIASVEATETDRVKISLTHNHLRPEALLGTMFLPASAHDVMDVNRISNGPYYLDVCSDSEAVFRRSPAEGSASPRPQEIVERHYAEPERALAALRVGLIQALDRVNPWDVPALGEAKAIKVEPYGLPLVHCLVPNRRRPLPAQRSLRRALEYGIDREAILHSLIAGRSLPGCRVLSGPFLASLGESSDTFGAYDPAIAPRRWDLRLATLLVREAVEALAPLPPQSAVETAPVVLVLAHPVDPVARKACVAIRQQLEKAGVTVQLKELAPDAPARPADDVDLVYAELAVAEPLVDARRLLGPDGPTGTCAPAMSLALRQAAEATDWSQARTRLRHVHRLAYDDTAVIALWQLTDYFARRETLQGVGNSPVSLYANVEQWNAGFSYPDQ